MSNISCESTHKELHVNNMQYTKNKNLVNAQISSISLHLSKIYIILTIIIYVGIGIRKAAHKKECRQL